MTPRLRGPVPGRARRVGVRLLAGLAMVVLVAAAGCKGSPTATPTSPAAARPSTQAQIVIVSPTGGSVVTGTTVQVTIALTGATLVPPSVNAGADPTHGHIHLSLDGSIVSMTSTLTYPLSVTPGKHILTAEFVASDHGQFSPRKFQTITFTVQ